MIDTNSITQAVQDVATVKSQLSPYVPALAVAAAWAGRELRNFNLWLEVVVSKVIAHGGIGYLLWKLIWNPPGKLPVATAPAAQK